MPRIKTWKTTGTATLTHGDRSEGCVLLDDIHAFIRRYVVLTDDQLTAISLWVAHTYAIDAATQTPYLNVNSAVLQCGKSRLLEVLEMIAHDAHVWIRPSEAVVYRYIKQFNKPTLLLDEVDAIWDDKGSENEGLRALINAGHREGAVVPRCTQFGREVEMFPVFCPKVLAGIGHLPATIADRSIPIKMKRKTSNETVGRFRRVRVEPGSKHIQKYADAWVKLNNDELREADPYLPDELTDRQQEAAEPLLAIADLAGGHWPVNARKGLINLFMDPNNAADETLRMRCLSDCREVFRDRWAAGNIDQRIQTSTLVLQLVSMADSPWEERGLTANHLAYLLQDFDVKPKYMRFPEPVGGKRGYERKDFEDAWTRYLPAPVSTDQSK